jgi:predicted DNA-binding WGR domain protein
MDLKTIEIKEVSIPGEGVHKVNVVERTNLICDVGGSNKFWNGDLFQSPSGKFGVALRWGRTGALGQGMVNMFSNYWDAKRYFDNRVKDKANKQYRASGTQAEPAKKAGPKVSKGFKEDAEWNIF